MRREGNGSRGQFGGSVAEMDVGRQNILSGHMHKFCFLPSTLSKTLQEGRVRVEA